MTSSRISAPPSDQKFIRDGSASDVGSLISIVGSYYQDLNLETRVDDPKGNPWAWIGEKHITCRILENSMNSIGFYISRHFENTTHLHAFFVRKINRGQGLGRKLILDFVTDALSKNSELEMLSLHMHRVNTQALSFYQKLGFSFIQQHRNINEMAPIVQPWAQNCKKKGVWPLKNGIDLLTISRLKAELLLDNSL